MPEQYILKQKVYLSKRWMPSLEKVTHHFSRRPSTQFCPMESTDLVRDDGAVEMTSAFEPGSATPIPWRPPHDPENGTYYPPVPNNNSVPFSSGRGWIGRLFQYKDPGSASYQVVREEEELAPLHRLNDPDHEPEDEDDDEDEDAPSSTTDFEMVDGREDMR